MRRTLLFTVISAALLTVSAIAQAPDSTNDEKLLVLIREVQAQQAQIADNEAKIEVKIAALAETVREARIFAGRGGK